MFVIGCVYSFVVAKSCSKASVQAIPNGSFTSCFCYKTSTYVATLLGYVGKKCFRGPAKFACISHEAVSTLHCAATPIDR